jgi:hypothetical protein
LILLVRVSRLVKRYRLRSSECERFEDVAAACRRLWRYLAEGGPGNGEDAPVS